MGGTAPNQLMRRDERELSFVAFGRSSGAAQECELLPTDRWYIGSVVARGGRRASSVVASNGVVAAVGQMKDGLACVNKRDRFRLKIAILEEQQVGGLAQSEIPLSVDSRRRLGNQDEIKTPNRKLHSLQQMWSSENWGHSCRARTPTVAPKRSGSQPATSEVDPMVVAALLGCDLTALGGWDLIKLRPNSMDVNQRHTRRRLYSKAGAGQLLVESRNVPLAENDSDTMIKVEYPVR
ncbi:hypothetical protein R3P38DRAFT_2780881 [Favolaschia claudopus]|uniref:Uncharacterized protein n=1 Tax=Favolaschia claudopus TaxID=2862362 RepID=A0AAW0B6I4_9AGAR